MSDEVLKEIEQHECVFSDHRANSGCERCDICFAGLKLARIAREQYNEAIQMMVAWKAARERAEKAEMMRVGGGWQMTGWTCPKCGYSWAPFVAGCTNCNQPKVTITYGTGCSCPDRTSAGCPIHDVR